MTDRQDDSQDLALQEAYANVYNELVKPDRVFVATQYFRLRWTPLLGPALAWVITALRQHCYWNRRTGEKRDWCTVSQDELAREVGISVATLKRLFNHEYAGRFIIDINHRYRYDPKLRKQVRKESMYRIRMDDPLIPEDEQRLKDLLTQKLSGLNVNPETGQIDILAALDRLSKTGMDDLQRNLSARSEAQAEAEAEPEIDQAVDRLAEQISGLLTGPNGHPTEAGPPADGPSSESDLPFPGGVLVHADDLRNLEMAENEVLVPWEEDYLVVPIVEVVRRDLRLSGGRTTNQPSTECYYSALHALGEGPEDWLPEEQARINHFSRLERELGEYYERLGATNLEEALKQYFSPQLTTSILENKSSTELEDIEGWVAYTRQTRGLTNPAGFLRSRIESGEQPPPLS